MFTRYTDPPEHRVWINPHPLHNGVSRNEVVIGSTKLREFIRYDLAAKYRWWVIAWEYQRLAAQRTQGAQRGEGEKLPRR